MLYVETVVVKKLSFESVADLKKAVQAKSRDTERRKKGLTVLSELLKKYRYELFNSFSGFSIITNGYGQFKEVQLSENNKRIGIDEIFNKLDKLIKE